MDDIVFVDAGNNLEGNSHLGSKAASGLKIVNLGNRTELTMLPQAPVGTKKITSSDFGAVIYPSRE